MTPAEAVSDSNGELQRLKRALRAMSEFGRAVARASSEQELLDHVCQVVVEVGGYRMAWVGYALQDEGKTLKPVAWAGHEAGYFKEAKISWGDNELGSGVGPQAIRLRQPYIVKDIANQPNLRQARVEQALERGYSSIIGLPLMQASQPYGCLVIYSSEKDAFSPEEVDLLERLVEDLVFGIASHRNTQTRKEMERTYQQLFDLASDAFILQKDNRLVDFNQRAVEMFGYPKEILMGKTAIDLSPEIQPNGQPSSELAVRYLQQVLSTGQLTFEWQMRKCDGSVFDTETSLKTLTLQDGNYLLSVIRDVSARKKMELAVQESEARYRSLFTDAPVAMLEEDFSEAKRQMDALRASGVVDFRSFLTANPAMVINLAKTVKIISMNNAALKLYGVTSIEEWVDNLSVILGDNQEESFRNELIWISEGRVNFHWDGNNRTVDGRLIHVRLHWLAPPGYESNLERVLVAVEDITEARRNAERIQQQLRQLNALRAIDDAISSNLDLRVTMRVLLDQVVAQLNVDAATALLYHHESQVLEYVARRGFRSTFPRNAFLQLGQGYAGQSALRRSEYSIFNLRTDEVAFPQDMVFLRDRLLSEGLSYCVAVPLIAKARIQGILELYTRSAPVLNQSWRDFMESLAGQAAIAIDNARLFEDLQRTNVELTYAYDAIIEGWTQALDKRGQETEGHTARLTELTLRLCQLMGLHDEQLVHIRRGCLLHDIGKISTPDAILFKPGPLAADEWEVIRRHPIIAHDMIAPVDYLRPALDIPYCHHERWDGSGYPRGLAGEQIPLAARVFAVVDVWDALISERPYRGAWPREQALAYIREQAGRQFDPQVVDLFLKEISRI